MTEQQQVRTADGGAPNMPWEPRVWNGMTVKPWFNLLARNNFRVSPTRWPMVMINSVFCLVNSVFALQQQILFGHRIAECEPADDPLFILGHWRTGTTWLHQLMALDERHAFPTTYQCLAPGHFIVSRPFTGWWLRLLLIAPGRLCVMRYEDLLASPLEQIRRIYHDLDLGGFENVKPRLQEFVAGCSDYVPNQHELSKDLRQQIGKRCGPYIEKYGYTNDSWARPR